MDTSKGVKLTLVLINYTIWELYISIYLINHVSAEVLATIVD